VILLAALALGIGTYSGGWRIMRTMGRGFADIESPQGFTAETSSMVAILASSHFGFGLSTTHVTAGAILGTGFARTPDEVRWTTARRMLIAWLLTLPAAAIIGALAVVLAHQGTWGVIAVLVLLIGGVGAMVWLASHNSVSHHNVNEHHEVTVLPPRQPVPAGEDD
jgi:PiT family inorganic phosphate transporter